MVHLGYSNDNIVSLPMCLTKISLMHLRDFIWWWHDLSTMDSMGHLGDFHIVLTNGLDSVGRVTARGISEILIL